MAIGLVIVVLWGLLLAPGALRWYRRRQPSNSIDSFHRQLRLLEGSGPKIVEPAYRLGDADREVPVPVSAPAPGPRLVLLNGEATDEEPHMRHAARGGHDDWYDDAPYDERADRDYYGAGHQVEPQYAAPSYDQQWDDWDANAPRASRSAHLPVEDYDYDEEDGALAPDRAKERRRRIIAGLGIVTALSLMLGLVTGASLLLAVGVFALVALVAYAGLMFYAHHAGLYGERRRNLDSRVVRGVPFGQPAARYREDEWDDEDWGDARAASVR